MFCAQCGGSVETQERTCPNCGAELWRSGAVRLTSPNEPASSLDDIFPEMATVAEPETASEVRARTAAGVRLTTRGLAVLGVVLVLLVLLLFWAL